MMHERTLKKIIDQLNNGRTDGLIFRSPLTYEVDFAKVWLRKPLPSDSISYPDGPFKFYFIKTSDGYYIGAVLDMTRDLHWYILPKFRRKGYLTNAMRTAILGHLSNDRDEQRITIDANLIGHKNFISSERVAIKLGFVKNTEGAGKSEYLLIGLGRNKTSVIDNNRYGIKEERMEIIKKQINFIGRSLWILHTEIEMSMGNCDYTEELKELVDEIRKHSIYFEDIWHEQKRLFI